MKFVRCLIGLMLLFFSAAGQANNNASRTLRVGIFPLEPICFMTEEGHAEGLIPDIMRAAFPADDGWHIEFANGSWAQGLERLQTGTIDLMPCITYSKERAEIMDFSHETAFESWAQVCALTHSEIETWDDLRNKTVAIAAGDINGINFIQTAQLLGITCQTVEVQTHTEVLRAVKTKQADAGVTPALFISRHAKEHNLHPTTIQFSPSPAFFAVKKGTNADILQQLDRVLEAWKKDQSSPYYHFVAHWLGGASAHKRVLPLWFWISVGGIFIAAAVLAGANRLLQHEVIKRTAELRKNEERFDIATDAGGIGIWDRDIVNDKLVWDDRMYKIYGIRKEDFGGAYEAWQQCIHPDDLERAVAEVTAAEEGEKKFDTTFRIIRPDGETRHIRAFRKIIIDKKGNPVRMTGTNQDVTELKQAEAEAERERLFSKSVISSLPGVFYVIGTDYRFRRWNANFETVAGYSQDEMRTISPLDLFPGDDKERIAANIRQVFESGTVLVEAEFVSKSGTRLPYLFAGTRIEFEGESLLVGMGIDISKQREAQTRLRESEEKLRGIVENSNNMFYSHTPDHVLTYVSPQVKDILGYEMEEALVRWTEWAADTPEGARALQLTEEAIRTGKAQPTYTLQLIHKDGHPVWVEVREAPVVEDGKTVAIVGSLNDITERKHAEDALKKNMEELERFNKAAVGRELRMIELKKEVDALCRELGREQPYPLQSEG